MLDITIRHSAAEMLASGVSRRTAALLTRISSLPCSSLICGEQILDLGRLAEIGHDHAGAAARRPDLGRDFLDVCA